MGKTGLRMIDGKKYQPQQDIAELMKLYDQEIKKAPAIPDRETLLLRARLIFEEALEFVEAAGCVVNADLEVIQGNSGPSLVEMADAIGDTLVVTYGAANALGIQVQPVWDEIQRSNLSKTWAHCSACDTELHEANTSKGDRYWAHELPYDHLTDWRPVFKIHKREDGKVVKPPTYSPASIEPLLIAQTDQYLQNLAHDADLTALACYRAKEEAA
jgi:hypothetical protein